MRKRFSFYNEKICSTTPSMKQQETFIIPSKSINTKLRSRLSKKLSIFVCVHFISIRKLMKLFRKMMFIEQDKHWFVLNFIRLGKLYSIWWKRGKQNVFKWDLFDDGFPEGVYSWWVVKQVWHFLKAWFWERC